MRKSFALFFCLLLCARSFAQGDAAQLIADLKAARNDTARARAYQQIVRYYTNINSDSAILYAQEGINLCSEHKYDLGKASLLNLQGGVYAMIGLLDVGVQKEEESLNIFRALNHKSGIANAQNSLGVAEGRKGNYQKAIAYFINSLPIFESLHDTNGIINTYIKLGAANDLSHNYAKSLEYSRKGLALSSLNSSPVNTIYLYSNIGTTYCRMNKFDSAKIFLQQAIDLSADPKYARLRISPLTNLGNIYKDANNPLDDMRALQYFRQALDIAEKEQQSEEYVRVSVNIAEIVAKKDLASAMSTLEKTLAITKETGQKELEADVMEGFIDAYVRKKDFENAFRMLLNKQALLDSIYDINKAKEIANLQAVYDLNKSNEQIAALKASEERNTRKRNIIIVIAFFLGASVITMLILYRKSRRLNVQLAKGKEELKKANDVKDKFFSIIGHDLNNSIVNMPVLLELYRHPGTSDEEKEIILNSLEETSQISGEILENLLNWGKSRIKGLTLKQTYFDATEIIETKIRLMRVAIKNKDLQVSTNIPQETRIFGDVNLFTFVIRNILSNAIKYTNAGGKIEVTASRSDTPGYVLFSIKDNGMGMGPEQLKNIFDPFNVSSPGTSNEAGNSIGLLLCKEFVVANGGKIWAESDPGHGSTFYFTFRLHE